MFWLTGGASGKFFSLIAEDRKDGCVRFFFCGQRVSELATSGTKCNEINSRIAQKGNVISTGAFFCVVCLLLPLRRLL